MSEASDAERIKRGNAAKRVLEEPIVEEALVELEAMCVRDWLKDGATDPEIREELHRMAQAGRRFRAYLTAALTSGTHQAVYDTRKKLQRQPRRERGSGRT